MWLGVHGWIVAISTPQREVIHIWLRRFTALPEVDERKGERRKAMDLSV